MSNVKFIVPKGQTKAGSIVEVVESDAASFDELGWERAEAEKKEPAKSDKKHK